MPVLVTDPTAPGFNSYATLEEADAYHASRLYSETWDAADQTTKEKALITATSLLDVSMLTRAGYTIPTTPVPQALKNATAELAKQVLGTDRTADNEVLRQGLTSLKVGEVQLNFDLETLKQQANGVLPGYIPDAVRMLLLPLWAPAYNSLIFKVN
jgi:hypothetical protein